MEIKYNIISLLLLSLCLSNFYSCSKDDQYSDNSKLCNEKCRASDKGIAENFVLKLDNYDTSYYAYKLLKDRANNPTTGGTRWIVVEKSLYTTKYITDYEPGYFDDSGNWHEGYYYTKEYSELIDHKYVAYDISNYLYGMNWSDFLNNRNPNGEISTLNPIGGNLYHDSASGFTFEESSPSIKDLEKLAAFKESYKTGQIAEKLSADFGLSEDRANKIAKLSLNWKKLSNKRSMTDADGNMLFNQIFGFSATDARKAMVRYIQGEKTGHSDLIEKAAKTNGVGPEGIKKILENYLQ
ncbi:MAG: hypothetical protein HQK51_04485 [Oligoflexia bacterium]|nr:hypothetical protein [Oligoflexia bacterium]